jgi:hypothetical protein
VTALWGPVIFSIYGINPGMGGRHVRRLDGTRSHKSRALAMFALGIFKRSDFAAVSTDGGADRMELENCVADFADRHGSPAINRRHPKKFWRGYIQHGWCCGRFGGNGTWAGLMFISGYAVAQT